MRFGEKRRSFKIYSLIETNLEHFFTITWESFRDSHQCGIALGGKIDVASGGHIAADPGHVASHEVAPGQGQDDIVFQMMCRRWLSTKRVAEEAKNTHLATARPTRRSSRPAVVDGSNAEFSIYS